ncbi:DarT ssDNA thymidine ADP-ribosyltransferase family protein [Sulfurimonas sp. HSL-1716]|uniref:DarT ssDNA thymidine ADP-ribosyltransferase family protein n=1 Tax=Hydrocurvibacter sulfurireducens TaxID=3131937 RepID=UPI0031F9B511
MPKNIKDGKLLYHLTALSNMDSILRDGLKARSNLSSDFKDVAEQDIIDFRNKHKISYLIPFHFFLGTPFAGRVQMNHPDEEFVYITIRRRIAANKENDFRIFPTHPKHMNPLVSYDYEEGIEKIDWELMNEREYSNPECKEVCMAECVANHEAILPGAFQSIIVKSETTKKYIQELYQSIYGNSPSFFINVQAQSFKGH